MLIISIAGGSASGKTSVASNIIKSLYSKNLHTKVTLLNMDSYYRDLSFLSLEDRKKINFDHPDSIDWVLFHEHINLLLQGKSIKKPIYSFIEYTRLSSYEVVSSNPVIIIEGLFSLYDKEIRKLSNIKIFVEAPDDIRLIRRIQRDIKERGRDIDSIIDQYLNYVRPMYVKYIEPTKKYADVVIQNENSFQAALDLLIAIAEKYIVKV
jgi:uridine kinase